MFQNCSGFKVSSSKTGIYQSTWRIPTSGSASAPSSSAPQDAWNYNMLTNTGGTFTSDPSLNTNYYTEYPPV